MANNLDVIDVIHGGAANPPVVPGEPKRFDQVDACAHACAKAHDVADIARNLGFEQGNAHGRYSSRCMGAGSPAHG